MRRLSRTVQPAVVYIHCTLPCSTEAAYPRTDYPTADRTLSSAGILAGFPFGLHPKVAALGLTNACAIAVDRQTFSTTAIKRITVCLAWLIATITKICSTESSPARSPWLRHHCQYVSLLDQPMDWPPRARRGRHSASIFRATTFGR